MERLDNSLIQRSPTLSFVIAPVVQRLLWANERRPGFFAMHRELLSVKTSSYKQMRLGLPFAQAEAVSGTYMFSASRRCETRRLLNSTESPADKCDHSGQSNPERSGKSE